MVAVNASTGAVVWKHETEEGVYSSPTITDAGKIVAPCIDGTLWVFSKSGEVELEKDLGDGMCKFDPSHECGPCGILVDDFLFLSQTKPRL